MTYINGMRKGGVMKSLAVAALVNNLTLSDLSVKADQPVHCLRDDAFGEWSFHVSKEAGAVNLFQSQEVCTHLRPNHIQIVSGDHSFKFAQEDVWKVKMLDQYKAEAVFCPDGKNCEQSTVQGKWSTIYDQAFRVELDNGLRFVSNFRYNVKPVVSEDPLSDGATAFADVKTSDYDTFISKCDESMVGFVQQVHGSGGDMKSHPVQCFYGKQTKKYDIEKSEMEEKEDGFVKLDKIVKHNKSFQPSNSSPSKPAEISINKKTGEKKKALAQEQPVADDTEAQTVTDAPADDQNVMLPPDEQNIYVRERKSHKRFNAHAEHVPSDETDLLISTINGMELGWKADTCKYQKHHESYGSHCEGLELAQVQAKGGQKEWGKGEDFQQVLEKAQHYQKNFASADEIPDSELTDNHDWRNFQGYDFTNPHRNQGHCGSCYTVSFTQIMESRLKLKYGKDVPLLSPQFLMTCNYMNEGCDGGWPFFHGYLGENGYLVTEECAPYTGKTKGSQCSEYEHCAPHSKVDNTYFIGRGYGDSSEKKIMKELLRSGLVNGEMNAPRIFSMYTQGILSQDGIKQLHTKMQENLAQTRSEQQENEAEAQLSNNITDKSIEDYGLSWQNLNHSVTIVGWGTDPETKTKYWIIRNSYGPTWGDHGDFLVQRGTNDFGIESETTAYDPVLL